MYKISNIFMYKISNIFMYKIYSCIRYLKIPVHPHIWEHQLFGRTSLNSKLTEKYQLSEVAFSVTSTWDSWGLTLYRHSIWSSASISGCSSEEFYNLSKDDLIEIISRDELNINSEEQVMLSIASQSVSVRWEGTHLSILVMLISLLVHTDKTDRRP